MAIRPIAFLAAASAALAMAPGAFAADAKDADYYRGGWRTEVGDPHVYEFVINGAQVTGVYCTHCADGRTLAPIEGEFDEQDGLSFKIRHLNLDGTPASEDLVRATLVDGRLIIAGTRGGPDGGAFEHFAIKDPRGPAPAPYPVAILPPGAPPVPLLESVSGGRPQQHYVAPAPWRKLSADDVVGVWLGFSVGMDKQFFIIRRDGDGLFGLACGRCDNPYTFGALNNFRINGDTLKFDIVHQDWGARRTPFVRQVTAHITMNEMRIDARRSDEPGEPGIVASLVGPIAIEATAGNIVGE